MFRLGIRSQDIEGECITLVLAQGSHKVKPLLQADCWVIFLGSKTEVRGGDTLHTLPLHPTSFGIG
jgi:molybdopterin biosynthesis enzyme